MKNQYHKDEVFAVLINELGNSVDGLIDWSSSNNDKYWEQLIKIKEEYRNLIDKLPETW